MKKFSNHALYTLIALASFGVGTPNAQAAAPTSAEKYSENLIQRDGVFYPTFAVAGKSYYNGEWYDTVNLADPNAQWRITPQEFASAAGYSTPEELAFSWGYKTYPGDVNGMLADYGFNSPQEMALNYGYPNTEAMLTDYGYSSIEEMAVNYGYGTTGDFQYLLDSYGQIGLANSIGMPTKSLNNAEKGSLLDAIHTNSLPEEIINELFGNYGGENPNFYTNGTFDPVFTNKLIAEMQATNNPNTQQVYQSLANHFIANPTGIGETDLSGWENPNLSSFPINQSNLTWDQINSAQDLSYADMSGMDVTDLQTSGKSLYGINFEGSNITGAQLNSAFFDLSGINLRNTNISGFSAAGKALSSANFTGATGITGANLSGVAMLHNTTLTGVNMTGFVPASNTQFNSTDFTGTTNLTGAMLNSNGTLQYANLSNQNLTGVNMNNRIIYGANFSNTTGLTATMLAQAISIHTINLSGTGITKAQLDAALIAVGKNPASGAYNTNTITF